jgi:hypothetical protein
MPDQKQPIFDPAPNRILGISMKTRPEYQEATKAGKPKKKRRLVGRSQGECRIPPKRSDSNPSPESLWLWSVGWTALIDSRRETDFTEALRLADKGKLRFL